MQRAPSRQSGAILMMTILFLILLLGFAALALDLGRLYVLRTEMQNAADAAALAAARELDGRENAIADAVIAAKELLSHRGRFSDEPELISILEFDDSIDLADPEQNAGNAIEFYRWISAEYDEASEPDDCVYPMIDTNGDGVADPETGNGNGYDDTKCLATGDNDAKYVRVKLYPEHVIDEKEYFQISLYFLPVLGLFLEDGTALTASTRVTAVAGAGGPVYCKYPPLFMCAYDEDEGDLNPPGEYPGIGIGEEVILRPQSASSSWGPGNVGYLDVGEDVMIPLDNGGTKIEKNTSAITATLGNEFLERSCSPAIVSTQTGINQQRSRKAFNTRFGIYEDTDGYENAKKAFPPAPNTVDYPRDDMLDPDSPTPPYDQLARKGEGWNVTECLMPLSGCGDSPGESQKPNPVNETSRPDTFNRADYILYNHQGGNPSNPDPTPSVGTEAMPDTSRFALYNWELNSSVNRPQLTAVPDVASDRVDCTPGDGDDCWLHSADPIEGDPGLGNPERRILRVAVIKCSKYGLAGNTPDINLNPEVTGDPFPFHRFFLTQHMTEPNDAAMYAEYAGPVENEDEISEIKHTVIQLYE